MTDLLGLPVRDVMTRDVVCVFQDFALSTLAELVVAGDLPGAPVVDDTGKLVGQIATSTLLAVQHDRTVKSVMTPVLCAIDERVTVSDAIRRMTDAGVDRAYITAGDSELVGVVTSGEVMRAMAKSQPGSHDQDRLARVGYLAGGVAHQINNALTSTRLSLGRLISFELSRRPISAARLHRIELLQDVREGMGRIERIVRELKMFSHTDESAAGPVDVMSLLESAIGLAAHEIRHRAQLVVELEQVPAVRARSAELRQVFLNLLVNAAQAIPEGEAHVNEVKVTCRADDKGRAVIEIHDTGRGMPADVRARIFEPFYTTRGPGEALGLGLAVCRDVVTGLDGEIAIESIEGTGTMVRIALPPCDAVAHIAPATPVVDSKKRRILIVDDDRPVAAAIALELGAHDVVVAESGREALEILGKDREFDVILCDLMMPEVSGKDVYEALEHLDPTLVERVVLMTGGAFTVRASKFLADVQAPVIEKPFHPEQLQAIVKTIDGRRARKSSDRIPAIREDLPKVAATTMPRGKVST